MTQHYVGTKIIQAYPLPREGKEGYGVQYPDGYSSWSPKDVFEEAYLPIGVIPAGTPDYVQRLIAERVQLFDRYTKLMEYHAAARNDSEHALHDQLYDNELEDMNEQVGLMRQYMHSLDQRIERHGFVFHETGQLFTVQQARAENRLRVEDIIVPIIAKFEKAAGLLDVAAANAIPAEIASAVSREFDVTRRISCVFDENEWVIEVNPPTGDTTLGHLFVFGYLECLHRTAVKYVGECLDRAFFSVLCAGNAPNDVVFMSYLTSNFEKSFAPYSQLATATVEGKSFLGGWQFVVKYSDELLKDQTMHFSFQGLGRVWRMVSTNSRQERFARALDELMTLPVSVMTAIYNKLDESVASVYDRRQLSAEYQGRRIKYKDIALERLQQMIAAATAARLGETKA